MDKEILKHLNVLIMMVLTLTLSSSFGQIILIPEDADWKYLDDGTDQDTAWRYSGFADSSWLSGDAELGYGDGDETTILTYGPDPDNKYITYYFRHEFLVGNPDTTSYLLLSLQRDDGAVVYINGTEVLRSNMPSDSVHYMTPASSTVGGGNEDTFFEYLISSDPLVTDTNLIAIEIHQRSKTSSDISLNLKLVTTSQVPPVFRKGPYLIYSGVNTEMMILWQLYESENCSVAWGTDTFYNQGSQITTEFGDDHQHSITLSSLINSTKYYYRIIADYDTVLGHFLTGPPDTISEITILAYGDTRTFPVDHDSVAEQIILNYTNNPDDQTILLLSGDLVGDGDDETDWDDQFFSPEYENIKQMHRTVPLLAATGNHEGTGLLFSKYFPYPFYSGGNTYWSFDYGPVHINIIDQYTAYSAGSAQYQWLVNDLSNTDKPWKIFALHEPGWSAGGGHGNNSQVQNVLQPLCEQYGVQFIIAGHNHYYSRAEKERVEHITTGGGGAPLHNPDSTYINIVKVKKAHHFCKLKINADTLHFTAIEKNGDIIEEFDYHRNYTWTGSVNSLWENGANWEHGVAPTGISNVTVPAGTIHYPLISDTVTFRTLIIEEGALLDVSPTGHVVVQKDQ